jgi:two-component system chemotaxis response regulator CheY
MGKILIVDDSVFIRNAVVSAIVESGHEPLEAENGQEALDILKNGKVDLIFSDVNMPIMGGLDMVKHIKEDEDLKYIPIIMLTTESALDMKEKGQKMGVQAWMVKPFKKAKALNVIKKLL